MAVAAGHAIGEQELEIENSVGEIGCSESLRDAAIWEHHAATKDTYHDAATRWKIREDYRCSDNIVANNCRVI